MHKNFKGGGVLNLQQPNPKNKQSLGFVTLLILDGFGITPVQTGNAILAAQTPNFNFLLQNFPHTKLQASADAVGLSWGEMGNSEVGHLNLGSGRVVWQDLPRITRSIEDGIFFKNQVLIGLCNHVIQNRSSLHLVGLVSNGGVHSHLDHLFALLKLASLMKVPRVYVHMITDGRDTEPKEALNFLSKLQERILSVKVGQIATVSGRFWAMDRDNRWDRIQKAYDAISFGNGWQAKSPEQAIIQSYARGYTDEFIPPTVIIDENNRPKATVTDHDALLFFNFRSDRMRQLSAIFTHPNFTLFPRKALKNMYFATMAAYEEEPDFANVVFPPILIESTLAETLSYAGCNQFHTAETEKYAHVTYFFNGGQEEPYPGEDRLMIPSPKVLTYDQKPDMSVSEVTKYAIEKIKSKKYSFIVINFANCDMVGHTGNFHAGIEAVEAVDRCLGTISKEVLQNNGYLIVTADHGNIEQMLNPRTSEIDKKHTTNPVPLIIASKNNNTKFGAEELMAFYTQTPVGILADITPTILEILQIEKPTDMTGISLLNKI